MIDPTELGIIFIRVSNSIPLEIFTKVKAKVYISSKKGV